MRTKRILPLKRIAIWVCGLGVLLIITYGFLPVRPEYRIVREGFVTTGETNRHYGVVIGKSLFETSNALVQFGHTGALPSLVLTVDYAREFVVMHQNARLERVVRPQAGPRLGIMTHVVSNGVFWSVVRGERPDRIKFVSGALANAKEPSKGGSP